MTVGTIDVQDLALLLADGQPCLIDVREPHEFAAGHISGARNVPLSGFDPDSLCDHADERLFFICAAGVRSARAADICAQAGFENVINVLGGMYAWRDVGLPVVV